MALSPFIPISRENKSYEKDVQVKEKQVIFQRMQADWFASSVFSANYFRIKKNQIVVLVENDFFSYDFFR